MKRFIQLIAVIILFASCQKGGTYYCRTYVIDGNTTTYNDDAVKHWFPSFNAMQNYEQKYKRSCYQKK